MLEPERPVNPVRTERERLLAAHRDMVLGLLEARSDPATARFDEALGDAEAAGLDERLARTLRWWQRESLAQLVEHAATVLPAALVSLDIAESAARTRSGEGAERLGRATSGPRRLIVAGLTELPSHTPPAVTPLTPLPAE